MTLSTRKKNGSRQDMAYQMAYQLKHKKIKPLVIKGFINHPGGEGGIRTRGRILSYTRFPGVRLKPLIHLSRRGRILAEAASINKPRQGIIAPYRRDSDQTSHPTCARSRPNPFSALFYRAAVSNEKAGTRCAPA